MKKILLATSALTMIAGAAAADMSVSGNGRMGLVNTGGTTGVEYRTRVAFSGSATTDSGISFGSYVRYRTGGNNGTAYNAAGAVSGGRVWVSNGTLTLTLGNQSGSLTDMTGYWGCSEGYRGAVCGDLIIGSAGFSSTGNQGVNMAKVQATFGNVSLSMSDGMGAVGANTEVSANFNAGSVNIGVGYTIGNTAIILTGATGGINYKVGYANVAGATNWILGGSYGMGAGTLKAYVASVGGSSNYNLTYAHDLGGATAAVGYSSIGGTATTEAGLSFNF